MDITKFQEIFLAYMEDKELIKEPRNLYEPIDYILNIGGKRIRPVLTLMGAALFSKNIKEALPAAYAIEMFHNFTLVHDDIMDAAPLRRGQETVHQKWDTNTGILSGDAMLIMAYQYFENYPAETFQELAKLFSKTALEVCDGQQLDIDFETRNDVTIPEYIQMISLKTSVLVGAAFQMGAIVAKAPKEEAKKLYDYGVNLGIAFQLQDDYLDTFGDPKTFGKQVGGDIIENKKTFLYLKTLEVANENDQKELYALFNEEHSDLTKKIERVTALFEANQSPKHIKELIYSYSQKAFEIAEGMNISTEAKKGLIDFGNSLMKRSV